MRPEVKESMAKIIIVAMLSFTSGLFSNIRGTHHVSHGYCCCCVKAEGHSKIIIVAMLSFTSGLFCNEGLGFIVRYIIGWEQERWLNNQDTSNNNEETEGHRKDGEKSLVDNPVKKDTEYWRGKAKDNEIPYWHVRNSCNTGKAGCGNCEAVQNKPSTQS